MVSTNNPSDKSLVCGVLRSNLFTIEFDISKLYIPNVRVPTVSVTDTQTMKVMNLIVADLQSFTKKGFSANKPQWIIQVNLYSIKENITRKRPVIG